MNAPDVVVTGTGRCGTNFMAQVLTGAGLVCTHEGYYTADGPTGALNAPADSSWMAVPYLEDRSRVVLLVREPLDVVRSLLGIRFFQRPGPYQRFALEHEPDLADLRPAQACWEWWTRWNRRALPHADVVVFLDDVRWASKIEEIVDLPRNSLEYAAQQIGTQVNARSRAEASVAQKHYADEQAKSAYALRDMLRAL